jgi:acyl-CoA thioesterase I
MRNIHGIGVLILLAGVIQLCGCSQPVANSGSRGGVIVCFGDSLTSGVGATEGNEYPALLAKMLGTEVINAGAAGDTTIDALRRLPGDVLRRDPRMVIVEFCGNDFLQQIPVQDTLRNIDAMVAAIKHKGAMVALVEVKAGYFEDEYLAGFKEIAKKRQAVLIPNILGGILLNPSLKSDGLHPNDAGYRLMAERIYGKIRRLLP